MLKSTVQGQEEELEDQPGGQEDSLIRRSRWFERIEGSDVGQ